MKTVSGRVENAEILIETIDEDVEIVGTDQAGRQTKPTGIDDRITKAYAHAKETIVAIARDMGKQFDELATEAHPKQVELEFSMGLSASTGLWVITAKGESALKVKMTWAVKEGNHSAS